jgi:hypothetical protein
MNPPASQAAPILRYKCWRSGTDTRLHLVCHEGRFEDLPPHIRRLGPWTGSKEGPVERLRPLYRAQLAEQGFALIYRHVKDLELEA